MAASPVQEHPLPLDAGTGRGWWRPLALPLCLSLVVHALAAGVYFGLLAGRASPVPGWLQRLEPPQTQPPQLAMTVIVVAGEGQPAAAEPAGMESPSPPALENMPEETEPPAASPPPTEPAAAADSFEPPPPPAPVEVAPEPASVPLPERAPNLAASPQAVTVPTPAPIAGAGTVPAAAGASEIGGSTAQASQPTQAATGTAYAPSGQGGRQIAGNFAGARLRQPPNLQRFYPYTARAQSITGITHLLLAVDAAGRVQSARVTASQPAGVFEQAAVRAARALRFEPARRNGQPIPADFELAIEWRLEP